MYPWPFAEFDNVMDDALNIAMDYLDQGVNFREAQTLAANTIAELHFVHAHGPRLFAQRDQRGLVQIQHLIGQGQIAARRVSATPAQRNAAIAAQHLQRGWCDAEQRRDLVAIHASLKQGGDAVVFFLS